MKTHTNIFLKILIISLALMACSDDNLQPEGQWELIEASIIYPEPDETIVLNQNNPNETVSFQWAEAISTENFSVTYSIVIDSLDAIDLSNPLLEIESANNGKDLNAEVTHQQLDEALAIGGYPANETAEVTFAVKATSLSKESFATQSLNLVRFETETLPTTLFLSGTATENEDNLEEAIALRRLNNSSGEPSAVFEVYSSLNADGNFKFYSNASEQSLQYGGDNGQLELAGEPIQVDESGEYRIQVDLENESYSLLKIEDWSLIGDPVAGGWEEGGEPLEYQGEGVWSASINLIETGGFAFRANQNWDLLMKRVVGTQLNVVMESQAESQGLTVEDIPSSVLGNYIITLNLSANGYNYLIEADDTDPDPLETPDELYLLANDEVVYEFVLENDQFLSNEFLPLQANTNYSLNSQADGSGTNYSVLGSLIGQSTSPNEDQVSDNAVLVESEEEFSVDADRALLLNFDFNNAQLNWTYYNFKLFHWSEWEARDEFVMTYVHPYQYEITVDLEAGYNSKFISPWDFEMGSDAPNSLEGNLINGGGEDINNIDDSGTYTVTINLDPDFQTGTYIFEFN
ncbi:MAG: SusE domain-containing protein [Flavobacteriaceae bacterium]|nr:SusE domain-containing protein [Flavobacteriaceae bacterium]